MLSYTTLQNLISIVRMVIDIAIITLLIFYGLKIIRNNTRTIQIFKGILLVFCLYAFSTFFGLQTVSAVANILVQWGFLAIIIIFQPEIRGILEKIGKTSVFSRISNLSGDEREKLVDELVEASMQMASQRVGALITIEQTNSLSDYIKTGTPMNSIVTADLLCAIFVTTTPLHDGAVIIQGDKLACASAYFLPTERNLPRRFGARHRAAVGISEITDSISIVVSEETGNISIAQNGELTKMTDVSLRQFLMKVICHEVVEHTENETIETHFDKEENEIYHSIIREQANIVEDEIEEKKVEELSYDSTNVEEKPEVKEEKKKDNNVLSILFKKKEQPKVEKKTELEQVFEKPSQEVIEEVQEEIKQEVEEKKVEEPAYNNKVKFDFSTDSVLDDIDLENWSEEKGSSDVK